jgi:hypothetical protein
MSYVIALDGLLFLILLKYFIDIFKSLRILREHPELREKYPINSVKKEIKNLKLKKNENN